VIAWAYALMGALLIATGLMSVYVLRLGPPPVLGGPPNVIAAPGGQTPPTGAPPTDEQITQRIRSVLIPLACQQLDSVNRDHGSARTDALAILALDIAIASGVVTYGITSRYSGNWWASLVLIGLSAICAGATRIPIPRQAGLAFPAPGASPVVHIWATLRSGFLPDEGSDPRELLVSVQGRPDDDAYEFMLAALIRSRRRSAASLRLLIWVLRFALLLLVVDGLMCAVLFLHG